MVGRIGAVLPKGILLCCVLCVVWCGVVCCVGRELWLGCGAVWIVGLWFSVR